MLNCTLHDVTVQRFNIGNKVWVKIGYNEKPKGPYTVDTVNSKCSIKNIMEFYGVTKPVILYSLNIRIPINSTVPSFQDRGIGWYSNRELLSEDEYKEYIK